MSRPLVPLLARIAATNAASKRGRGTRDNNNNSNKRNKTSTGRRDQNPKRTLPKIRVGHYSEEEWKALSDHDRGLVLDLRLKQKQANATAAAVQTSPAAAPTTNGTASISSITVSVQATEPEIREALARTNITPPASVVAGLSEPVTLGEKRRGARPKWFDRSPAAADVNTNSVPADTVTIASVTTVAPVAAAAAPIVPPAAAGVPVAAANPNPKVGLPWYAKLDNPRTLTKSQKSKRAKHIRKQPFNIVNPSTANSDDSETYSYDNGCYHESDSDFEDDWVDPMEAHARYEREKKTDPDKALARYCKDMDKSTLADPPAGPKTD